MESCNFHMKTDIYKKLLQGDFHVIRVFFPGFSPPGLEHIRDRLLPKSAKGLY